MAQCERARRRGSPIFLPGERVHRPQAKNSGHNLNGGVPEVVQARLQPDLAAQRIALKLKDGIDIGAEAGQIGS